MTPLAHDLARRGYAVWNIEYRRVGQEGGGWPGTLEDAAAAIDHLVEVGCRRHRAGLITVGHSAGGHLAVWLAARHRLPAGAVGSGPRVRPCAAVSQAGVLDLVRGAADGLGSGACAGLLGGEPDAVPDRYEIASPLALLPLGVPVLLVHGERDDIVPPSQSDAYAAAARAAGDEIELVRASGSRPLRRRRGRRPAWLAVVERLPGSDRSRHPTVTGVRIALLGAGLIGREHAALVAAHPAASLVAIADPAAEAVGLAASLGAQHYDDYEQMLDEVAPDGVIVALPNTLHVDAGLACIARGIPVLVEKPIADTVASAMRLVEAGEEAGIPVLVGHHRRHGSDIREAKRAIESGELGRIVAINGIAAVAKHDTYFDADWRRLPGGGPLLINAIHDIDCFRTLCGEIESVQAIGSSAVRGHAVEDTVAVALQFAKRRCSAPTC